jgi:hypothetical protein
MALVANADLLGRRWFLKQVDHYFAHADVERARFLSEQMDDIEQSGIATALSALLAEEGGASKSMWASLSQRVQHWSARLAPGQRAQVQQYVAAVQGNLLWRTLRASFRSSG